MRIRIIVLLSFVFLVLNSCQTGPSTWDSALSAENSAEVKFVGMHVLTYNGINVRRFNWAIIPPGQTTISANLTINHAGLSFSLRDMEFTFDFKAGKIYRVTGSTHDMQWGVNIFEDDELLTFRPFLIQPIFTR
ncbi:MAG: hypothetical protein FWC01_01740 [Treponema sp.]|nr:hypothetical protein [Treponema sp.]MCL2236842.1 hypothetical protein [Treponema sp.]